LLLAAPDSTYKSGPVVGEHRRTRRKPYRRRSYTSRSRRAAVGNCACNDATAKRRRHSSSCGPQWESQLFDLADSYTECLHKFLAYSVAQRTNEFGIRLALGAAPTKLMTIVLGESSWISGAGVAVGLGRLSCWRDSSNRCSTYCLLRSIHAAERHDLVADGWLGVSWIPARRAAKMDPIQALRSE